MSTQTQIQTQNVYIVESSLTFNIPKSYDPEYMTLEVFGAFNGSTTGVPLQYALHPSGDQVIVEDSLRKGDVIVVRCRPQKEKLFIKATRQALTSTQVNELYTHCMALASSADDKILAQYGIVITGSLSEEEIAKATDLLALEAEVDTNTDDINRSGDGILVRLDALEAGGDPGTLTKASKAQAQLGDEDSTYMTPLRTKDSIKYRKLQTFLLTILPSTRDYTGSGTLFDARLPKAFDGMYIKDLQVEMVQNPSLGTATLSLKQDTTLVASADLDQNVTYVDASTGAVTIPSLPLDKTKSLTYELTSVDRVITGLVVTLTVGNLETEYVP